MVPAGLGIWVWQLAKCEGGDLGKIADKAARCAVGWLCLKSGDDDDNHQVTADLVTTLHGRGLGVYTWNYCVPGDADLARQLVQIARMRDLGVDGHYLDGEIEWEKGGDRRPEAAAFAAKLRAVVGPGFTLGHAPWPIVGAHPRFPWTEFGRLTDVQSDQVYWTMQNGSAAAFMDRADAQWANLAAGFIQSGGQRIPTPDAVKSRCPIGSAFDGQGQRVAVSDVLAFLDRYQAAPSRSLWSWQHLPDLVWKALEDRATVAPVVGAAEPNVPDPTTNGDGSGGGSDAA